MIEDKPHKIGPILAHSLLDHTGFPILLAVAPHRLASNYFNRLQRKLNNMPDLLIEVTENGLLARKQNTKQIILRVIMLDRYSKPAAEMLLDHIKSVLK